MRYLFLLLTLFLWGCSTTPLSQNDQDQFNDWRHRYHDYRQEPHEWWHYNK